MKWTWHVPEVGGMTSAPLQRVSVSMRGRAGLNVNVVVRTALGVCVSLRGCECKYAWECV